MRESGSVRESGHLGRSVLPAVVVAAVVFQMLRIHIAERYIVPSRSMEPTLHGDPVDGDLVLVDKTAWWWRTPERFDLVVVRDRRRGNADPLVKRSVSMGTEYVALREGDIFVGEDPAAMQRVVKSLRQARRMRLTSFAFEGHPSDPRTLDYLRADPGSWRLLDGALELSSIQELASSMTADAVEMRHAKTPREAFLPGHLSTARSVDTSFLDSSGSRLAEGRDYPRDIGIDVSIRPTPDFVAIQLVVELLQRYYSIRYEVSGEGRFQVMGADFSDLVHGPPIPRDRVTRLVFGYLDGRFFLECEGTTVCEVPFELPSFPLQPIIATRDRPFENLVHVGCTGGNVRIERLAVFQDIYYRPEIDRIYHVQTGEVFLLGDNTYDSSDSREPGVRFEREDLVGRPIAILGPWSRVRWLLP
jgi:signal peptidase I